MPRRRRYDLGDVADRPQLDALRACDDSRTARDTSALWTGGRSHDPGKAHASRLVTRVSDLGNHRRSQKARELSNEAG